MNRRQCLVAATVLSVSGTSSAAVTVNFKAQHRTGRLVAHALKVLRAHDQACDRGCRFSAPDVARSVIIKHGYNSNRYFVWTHVQSVKDSRTFQKVTITSGKSSTLFHVSTPSPAEIRELEARTKFKHEPILDRLDFRITLEEPNAKNGSLTNIYVDATAQASGMVGMFKGVIRSALKANAEAIFANIDR